MRRKGQAFIILVLLAAIVYTNISWKHRSVFVGIYFCSLMFVFKIFCFVLYIFLVFYMWSLAYELEYSFGIARVFIFEYVNVNILRIQKNKFNCMHVSSKSYIMSGYNAL